MIGLSLVMVVGYGVNTVVTIPKLRRFLQSEEGQSYIRGLKMANRLTLRGPEGSGSVENPS